MQTILGSGGAIGTELAKALSQYTTNIRLVSRNPKRVNDTDQLFSADLTQGEEVDKAVEGSEICYITVGFEYKLKVWEKTWLPFIQNVTKACKKHNCKLVFFDNVYAIGGKGVNHITETSIMQPTSRKGEIRAAVDKHILAEIEKGNITAMIARAPDFFGPIKEKSFLMSMVYDNLNKGRTAMWFNQLDKVHSMGYTPDLALGTAILGNTPSAYNQIWNLPVAEETLTGKQWIQLFAEELKTTPKTQVLSGFMQKVLSLFIPILRETKEMTYQFEENYVFDSTKFNATFNFIPTSNRMAVRKVIESLKLNTV